MTIDVILSIVYAVGGVIFDSEVDPQLNGVEDVTVTVDGTGGTYTACTSGASGLWVIEGIPEGTYTGHPGDERMLILAV